jgi:hypothetical protein
VINSGSVISFDSIDTSRFHPQLQVMRELKPLLWQPYPPHQLSKPWIGTQRVEQEISF